MTGTEKTKVWIEEKQQIAVRDLFSEARHAAWARGEDDPGSDYEADGFCLPEHAEGETFSHVGPLGIENTVITAERLRELEPDAIIIVTDEDVEAFRKRLFGEEEEENEEEGEGSSSSGKEQENEEKNENEEKSEQSAVAGKILVKNLDQIRDDGIEIDRYNGGWLKKVTGLNKERLNGYSIEGEFVRPPFYITPGDVILDCSGRVQEARRVRVYRHARPGGRSLRGGRPLRRRGVPARLGPGGLAVHRGGARPGKAEPAGRIL